MEFDYSLHFSDYTSVFWIGRVDTDWYRGLGSDHLVRMELLWPVEEDPDHQEADDIVFYEINGVGYDIDVQTIITKVSCFIVTVT